MGSPVSVVIAEISVVVTEIVMHLAQERALATCRQTIPLWTVTLRRHLNRRSQRRNWLLSRPPKRKERHHPVYLRDQRKWKTSFSRLLGKPRQQRTANDSVQKTDKHRQVTWRNILQPDFTQSHDYKTLTRRAQLVCDAPDSLRDENRYRERVFRNNKYNVDFNRQNIYRPTDSTKRNPTPVSTVTIPYIKDTSETISRILRP